MTDTDRDFMREYGLDPEEINDQISANGHGRVATKQKTPKGFSFGEPRSGIVDPEEFWQAAGAGEAQAPEGITHYPATVLGKAPDPQPRDYMLEGLVPCGAATAIYGEGGVAKSLLGLSLGLGIAYGHTSWLGRATEGGAVMYLDFELTQDEQVRRAKALSRGSGYDALPEYMYYLSAMGKDKASSWYSAFHACAWYGCSMMIVDSLGIALDGEANNATDVVNFYRNWLEPFIAQDIAVLIIDHQSKGGNYQEKGAFGSVYKRNLVRSELQVEKVDDGGSDGTMEVVFRHRKHNFGALARPFGAQLAFKEGEVQVNTVDLTQEQMMREQGAPTPDRVVMALEMLGDPATPREIAELIEVPIAHVKTAVSNLRKRGRLTGTGDRSYGQEKVALIASFGQPHESTDDEAMDDDGQDSVDF